MGRSAGTLALAAALAACGGSPDEPAAPDGGGADAAVTTAALCINEIMAENAFTLERDGGRPDWIELHNAGDDDLDLGGYTITDDLAEPARHVVADGLVVPAGGFVLLLADGDSAAGPDHLGFSLDKHGEAIGLFDPDGRPVAVIEYGEQVTDWSAAHDGNAWTVERDPTPGASNGGDCAPQPSPSVDTPDAIAAVPDPSGELYDPDALPELRLELSDAALAALADAPYEYVEGALVYRGRRYEPIGVRLKGQSSFLPITAKPSLKLEIDEYVDGAELLELERITLNNMRSDPTMMRERLAYAVFRQAGVPASRCNHARVYVNGEYYGLYANLESVDDRMMARWFEDGDGPLYEGWDVDFVPELVDAFEHEAGPDDRTHIAGLADALALEPADAALAAAGDHADLAQYRLFWAVTAAVGQFDAYPYHLDDFHIYDDPTTQRLQFIPWGTDESFDARGHVGWIGGRLSLRCAAVRDCLLDWAYGVFDIVDLMDAMDLLGEVDAIEAQIADAEQQDLRKPYGPGMTAAARAELRAFIAERRETLLDQFSPQE